MCGYYVTDGNTFHKILDNYAKLEEKVQLIANREFLKGKMETLKHKRIKTFALIRWLEALEKVI